MSIDSPPTIHRPQAAKAGSPTATAATRGLALVAGVVCLLLLGFQIATGWEDLHSTGFFTALAAHKYVWTNALAAVVVALTAALAPGRLRWLAVLGPGVVLVTILLATAILGGQAPGMLAAIVIMAALWDTGERLLRRLGAEFLARNALVAWLAGIAPWSLGMIALGRLSAIRWWTAGLPIAIIGAVGCLRLGRRALMHRRSIATEVTASPLHAASTGLVLLTTAWAAIYAAAPEIQYDALYGKASLPEIWARTGHIGSLVQHVQFEITGWFQILATYGHALGAPSVGRYLQLIALVCAPIAVWWWGRHHGTLGSLAAVAIAVTPHLFWQASTADDDLLLALCALALCIAVVESQRASSDSERRSLAFAIGLMAGSGPSLKLHLVPLFAFLLLGWVISARGWRAIRRRLAYSALGAAITGLPPLVLRWIDSGNPLLPAYNNIFRSPDWLPINETANFPFWSHPGSLGPIRAIWVAVGEPQLMAEATPPGAFGVLVGAIVVAALLGWIGHDDSRASRIVWIALIPALIFWWVSLRYLRYLLPVGFVSVALILMLSSKVTIRRTGRSVGLIAVTLAAVACFPVAISQFWNVPAHKPPVYAAFGKWSASSYEDAALTERPALLAFNRLSPPRARVATSAYEREWLTQERDLYNVHYEVMPLMELHGPAPVSGQNAYRALGRLGIEWVLVNGVDRLLNEPGYLSEVLSSHGKIEFGARGWDLYRLVPHPPAITPLMPCDRGAKGVPPCWGGPRGVGGSLSVSVTRNTRVCAGEILAVTVTAATGGAPSPVLIHFNGGNPQDGVQPGESTPGLTQRIYATAPPGATSADIVVSPSPSAPVVSASIGSVGPACAGSGHAL